MRVGSGEGDEQIAGAVAGDTARASQPERSAPGDPFQLVRQQRRVGRDDNDDGAGFAEGVVAGCDLGGSRRRRLRQLSAHRRAGHPQQIARAVIRLDQHADGIAAEP